MTIHPAARKCGSRRLLRALFALAAIVCGGLLAMAQNDNPLTPVPPRAVRKIPTESHAEPALIPPEKIIQSFAAREDEYLRAHQMYSFKRSVRIQEFPASGEQGGEILEESEVYLADNGRRYERATQQHTRQFMDVKSESVDAPSAAKVPLFPLVSDQIKFYSLIYKGTQPLDELHAYIFEVKPKRLLPNYRLFTGLVYVDDQDLAIVKIYGKWIALEDEDAPPAHPSPFSMYEMYYENVDGKYWFPTYLRSDAYVRTKAGEDQLRLIVKMADFKVAAPVQAPTGGPPGPGPGNPSPATPRNPPKPDADRPAKPPA